MVQHALVPPGMRLIPVMDIRGGVVVRAVAGRRAEYRPVVSRLTNSTDPLIVAEALRAAAGTDELYVADLDAIEQRQYPNYDLVNGLAAARFKTWVDNGVRMDVQDEILLQEAGAFMVVAGLETVPKPDVLNGLTEVAGPQRLAFSLDLEDGRPRCNSRHWPWNPKWIIDTVWQAGIRRLIVLDLARVGVGGGTGTLELCAWAKSKYPHLELIAGGGVRGPEDLPALADAGVDAVLVASALHDGKFGLPAAPH